mmetsp:Transcript_75704/g.136537  ORF Transcript_75704/g.136537 Transcript_75704/m.136537 type:complete len:235 (+) Transcript_75704:103-807(+)
MRTISTMFSIQHHQCHGHHGCHGHHVHHEQPLHHGATSCAGQGEDRADPRKTCQAPCSCPAVEGEHRVGAAGCRGPTGTHRCDTRANARGDCDQHPGTSLYPRDRHADESCGSSVPATGERARQEPPVGQSTPWGPWGPWGPPCVGRANADYGATTEFACPACDHAPTCDNSYESTESATCRPALSLCSDARQDQLQADGCGCPSASGAVGTSGDPSCDARGTRDARHNAEGPT